MLDKFAAYIRKKLKPFDVYIICILVLIIVLFMIFDTSRQIHQYSQSPVVVTEKLLSIDGYYNARDCEIKLEINGNTCEIYSSFFTRRTYGLVGGYTSGELIAEIGDQLGMEFHLEYIPLAKNSKILVALTVGDTIYVDKEIALNDYII